MRSFQWDLARQVERLDWLLAQLPRYADWGYQEVHLHLEDAVEYPSLPGVARRDAYTYRQFERLVAAATHAGIKVVPIVNLLGHTQYLVKVPALRDLNELRAPDGSPLERGQICPLHPRTLEVAEKLLRDMAPFCTAGKVHVGLDESFHLGQHPLSQKEVADIGLAAHFAGHVNRLHALVRGLGLRMGMWADMLYFLPDAIPLLPHEVTAYEWYYYAFRRRPRVELFNFAEADLATPLRARGIAMYGCPMDGAFRYEPLPHFSDRMANLLSWWRYSRKIGAEGFLVSGWEPYRLALELTTAIDAAAAGLWLDPEIDDPRELLARGFARAFGKKGRAAARMALACDRYPFSGYPRWQVNDRWDTVSRRESLTPYRAEQTHFRKLARRCAVGRLPAPLRASVEFRSYLAARDVYVRAGGVRPAVPAALRAARTMWGATRDPRVQGPNEQMLLADARRLRAGTSAAGWQLCYRVWNFAPAMQFVGVEQQEADGSWRVLQSCHTIEFQDRAARRRGDIVREHAAPVAWSGAPAERPRLRLFVRGLGQVRIGSVEWLGPNGERVPVGPSNRGPRPWKTLGRPAPRSGWPKFDWTTNCGEWELPPR